jgi:hypothetical protein
MKIKDSQIKGLKNVEISPIKEPNGLVSMQRSRYVFGRCSVRILVRTPDILRDFVVFLSSSRHMPGLYLD